VSYADWIKSDRLSSEELDILSAMSDTEKDDAFSKLINFGTAGLRGIIGLGTNRMNVYTVSHVTQAIANYMKNKKMNRVVVACDTRNGSKLFMNTTVDVFLANNIEVFVFNKLVPVPVLSFATKELGCNFGVYITASHNTKEYNGYKLYDSTGCQILEDVAEDINYYRDELDVLEQRKRTDKNPEIIADSVFDKFVSCIKKCKIHNDNNLSVTYTGLFGTGNGTVDKLLLDFKSEMECEPFSQLWGLKSDYYE
jgi:phosphoglucomutase